MKLIGEIPAQLRSDDDLGKVRKTLDKILEYNLAVLSIAGIVPHISGDFPQPGWLPGDHPYMATNGSNWRSSGILFGH